MSLDTIFQRLTRAFDALSRLAIGTPSARPVVRPGRPRLQPSPTPVPPHAVAEGFEVEAVPWLSAVYRFALRLTRGDEAAAEDLVQETFLRAYRAWDSFTHGTNCRAWLFRICRNAYLHDRDRASTRHEVPESSLGETATVQAVTDAFGRTAAGGQARAEPVFESVLDERVVRAIDDLPDEYRDALVLSDIGDLTYAEIATVLDIPVGTVKSRIFRARQALQVRLVDYAIEMGYIERGRE